MNRKLKSLAGSLVLALLLIGGALALLGAGDNGPPPVLAQGPDGHDVYYVSVDGNCGGETPCYTTVQDAVDAVDDPTDEVWVATGVYTGVNAYGGLSQMVYISKSLTLRGGANADFSAWDPALYTTTLDAQSNGRVIYATGPDITVTLEGLDIYDGYALDAPKGSGVYLTQASATITNCTFRENGHSTGFQNRGGGLYISSGSALIAHNNFYNNQADFGGALSIESAAGVTLRGNHIHHNLAYRTASSRGGGIHAYNSPYLVLEDNEIYENQAGPSYVSQGGGISLVESDYARLENNRIYNNEVQLDTPSGDTNYWRGGGGLDLWDSDHVLITANQIYSNTVWGDWRNHPQGGGVRVEGGAYLTFTHNTLYGNAARGSSATRSVGRGGGLYTQDIADSQIAHNEVYSNTSSHHGGGVYLVGDRLTFVENQVYGNDGLEYDSGFGGGLYAGTTNSFLSANQIHHNATRDNGGGGMYLTGSGNVVAGNLVYANTTTGNGGGVQVAGSAKLVNNVIVENTASGSGAGLAVRSAPVHLWHTTLARNDGPNAIYVYENGTAVLTNTLVVSAGVGIEVQSGMVTTTLTLWDSVLTPTVGLVDNFGAITGTAAFAADGYHLTVDSDALDVGIVTADGVATAISEDIDGQPRPMGNAPDLGADEYPYYADFALSKSGPASGNAGEMLVYTLTVTNAVTSELAADVRVVDTVVPTTVVAVMSASGGDCATDGASLTCTLYNVATDTQRLITVWITSTADYDGVLTNTASVAVLNAIDLNEADNADAVTTTLTYVPLVPDLWVEKTAPPFVEPGAPLLYNLSWGNAGGVTAYTVTLTDTLPGGVNFQSADPSPDSTDPLVWNLDDLAPGETATATVRVVVGEGLEDGTALINHVAISSTTAEAVTLNNTDTATTTVYELGGYDLALTKAADADEVEVGDTIVYALWVTNTGVLPANVTLEDAIPEGTAYVPGSALATGGVWEVVNDRLTWSGELEPDKDVLITFDVTVEACGGVECGLIHNEAQAEIDGVAYVWEAQVDTTVLCPDLTIMGAGPERNPQYSDGTHKRYDVVFDYANLDDHAAPGVARNTSITITAPAGARFSASDPVADFTSPDQRTKVWHLGDLAAGAEGAIQVQVEPQQWLDDGVDVAAVIAAQPGVECDPHAENEDTVTTYPVKMELEKGAHDPRVMMTYDAQVDALTPQWNVEYLVRYRYQTADPALPPVTQHTLTDHWPADLTLERQLSQPALKMSGGPPTLRFDATAYVQEGDSGWLRLQGSTTSAEPLTVTNQIEQVYETPRSQGTGSEVYTDSAHVEIAVPPMPLMPPHIAFPESGETCAGLPIEFRGVAQRGVTVTIYMTNTSLDEPNIPVAQTLADAHGRFTVTVNVLPGAGDAWQTHYFVAKSAHGDEISAASNEIWLGGPSVGGWCPQTSYWEATYHGRTHNYVFRSARTGTRRTRDWQIPRDVGYRDTQLHLYSCCTEATQAMTVTVDGAVYTPASREGHWYHFDIAVESRHVIIESQCGEEVDKESGVVLIDPDGYVFNVDKGGYYDPTMGGSFNPVEAISGVTVTAYVSMPHWGGWVPWPAHLYEDQVNPQVTDDTYPDGITTTGYYAFFTPPGHYYIQVEGIDGYQAWRSPVVEVITQIVHVNVPYTPWVEDVDVYSVTVMPAPMEVGGGTLWVGVHLDPAVITVPVGSVVEWTSALSETNTIDDLIRWSENPIFQVLSERDALQDTRGFDSGYLEPGRVYRRAFAYPGVYTYTVYGRSGWVIVTDERSKIYLPLVLRE